MEIRNEIARVLERGKVDFSLWVEKKECADTATPINQVLVEGYYNQIKAISENLHIAVPTDWFQTLLRMPDVMTRTDKSIALLLSDFISTLIFLSGSSAVALPYPVMDCIILPKVLCKNTG